MTPSFLFFHSARMQISQSPWDSQKVQPVSAVMPDLSSDPRHRVAADPVAAVGLKILHRADQSIAAFLNEIIVFAAAVVQQAVGSEVRKSKVLQHGVISLQDPGWDPAAMFMAALTLQPFLNCFGC